MQAGFQAIERMEYLALSDVINKSSQGLLGVILALIGFRSTGIVACWTITAGVVLILNAFWMRQRVHIPIQLNTNRRELYSVARESIAYWAFGVFMMLYLWIDTVMLSLLTRPEVVGWYGVPTKLFQSLMFLPALMSTAWLPRLVSAHENGGDKLQRESRKPLELLLVASIPICAVTAATAGPVMHVLYGSAYDESVPVLIMLALCVPPMYVNIMLNQVLVAAKRQTAWTWVLAGATIFNPLVNLALIPYTENHYGNGAIGAAIALFLTELGIVAVGLALFGRGLVTRATVRRCVPALVSSGALWGVALPASASRPGHRPRCRGHRVPDPRTRAPPAHRPTRSRCSAACSGAPWGAVAVASRALLQLEVVRADVRAVRAARRARCSS